MKCNSYNVRINYFFTKISEIINEIGDIKTVIAPTSSIGSTPTGCSFCKLTTSWRRSYLCKTCKLENSVNR